MTGRFYVRKARQALDNLFSDTTVERTQTLEDLKGLREQIDTMIEAIEDDIEGAANAD